MGRLNELTSLYGGVDFKVKSFDLTENDALECLRDLRELMLEVVEQDCMKEPFEYPSDEYIEEKFDLLFNDFECCSRMASSVTALLNCTEFKIECSYCDNVVITTDRIGNWDMNGLKLLEMFFTANDYFANEFSMTSIEQVLFYYNKMLEETEPAKKEPSIWDQMQDYHYNEKMKENDDFVDELEEKGKKLQSEIAQLEEDYEDMVAKTRKIAAPVKSRPKQEMRSMFNTEEIQPSERVVLNTPSMTVKADGRVNLYTNKITVTKNKKEESKKMKKNKGFNLGAMFGGLEFGAIKGDEFKLSAYGVAFQNKTGNWNSETDHNGVSTMSEEVMYVAYDKNKGELVNVDCMNFEGNGLLMKMPIAMSQVAQGDIIIHQNNPVVVKAVREDGNLEVISPGSAEIKIIMPVKNMFGFNFYTKVMPLIDMNTLGAGANDDNPFGAMMPMMMMSSMMGEDNDMDPMTMMFMMNSMNGGTMDMQSMLPLMMIGGNNKDGDMMQSIMMMNMMSGEEMDMQSMLPLMLLGGNKEIDPMMFLMMSGQGLFAPKKKEDRLTIEEWNKLQAEKAETTKRCVPPAGTETPEEL